MAWWPFRSEPDSQIVITEVSSVMAWWPFRSEPSSQIADGTIAVITGIVRPVGPLLEAPLTGRPAVAYTSIARIADRRIKMSYGLRHLITADESRAVPFDLETADRVIRVDVTEVDLAIAALPSVPRHFERERAFLDKLARGSIDVRLSMFEERCLEPGASVQVRGLAVAEADPASGEHGFRDAATRFRIIASDKHPVRIRSAR